jgi:heat shock protein HtpX
MAALIALLGIGGWAFAGTAGLYAMIVVGLLINVGSYWFSDRIALAVHGARPVTRRDAPSLYQLVADLAHRAGMPVPRVYVIPSDHANAFATGRGPDHAAVAVTEGLVELLDDRELEGVLAHELSHVRNRDVLIATIAAGIAGVISSIGYALQWDVMLGNGDRGERRDSGLAALAWIVVAPVVALLLQLALSRAREYEADATGARLTGDPDALADALARLEVASERRPYGNAGPATAHLFIVNPLRGGVGRVLALLSTHPPIADRIARLRTMAAAR